MEIKVKKGEVMNSESILSFPSSLSATEIDQRLGEISKIKASSYSIKSRVFISGDKIKVKNSFIPLPSFVIKIMDYLSMRKEWQLQQDLKPLSELVIKMKKDLESSDQKAELKNLKQALAKIEEIQKKLNLSKLLNQNKSQEKLKTSEAIARISDHLNEMLPLEIKIKKLTTHFVEATKKTLSSEKQEKLIKETLPLFTKEGTAFQKISIRHLQKVDSKDQELSVPQCFDTDILRMQAVSVHTIDHNNVDELKVIYESYLNQQDENLNQIQEQKKIDLVNKMHAELGHGEIFKKVSCLLSQSTFASSSDEVFLQLVKSFKDSNPYLNIGIKQEEKTMVFKIELNVITQKLTLEAKITYQITLDSEVLANIPTIIRITAPVQEWDAPIENNDAEKTMPHLQVTHEYSLKET